MNRLVSYFQFCGGYNNSVLPYSVSLRRGEKFKLTQAWLVTQTWLRLQLDLWNGVTPLFYEIYHYAVCLNALPFAHLISLNQSPMIIVSFLNFSQVLVFARDDNPEKAENINFCRFGYLMGNLCET